MCVRVCERGCFSVVCVWLAFRWNFDFGRLWCPYIWQMRVVCARAGGVCAVSGECLIVVCVVCMCTCGEGGLRF